MKIVLTESLGIPEKELAELAEPLEKQGHSFVFYEKTTDTGRLAQEVKDADVIMLANMPMPAQVLSQCENLKYVDIAFTGVDHVAVDVLRERNIPFSNASGYSTEAVAELGIGMALSVLRNMRETEAKCREGGTKAGLVGTELAGKTCGIVGLGHIGTRTAELLHAFRCRVLAVSRTRHEVCPDYVEQTDLDTLLRESDIVFLHCPLNASTRNMIAAEQLAVMKNTAVLINLARGPVVNSADLKAALDAGVIAAAASDVFEKEPPLDESEPLLSAKNTLLTPHIAFATRESMQDRARIVFDNLYAFLNGEIRNRVN